MNEKDILSNIAFLTIKRTCRDFMKTHSIDAEKEYKEFFNSDWFDILATVCGIRINGGSFYMMLKKRKDRMC